MTQNDSELRRWCIEKALESGATEENCVEVAQSLFRFIKDGGDSEGAPGVASLDNAKALTKKQKEVLEAMLELHRDKEPVNGSSIRRHLGITQSYASSILRKLIKLGYVHRDGNKFWPVRHPKFSPEEQ